MPNTEGYVSESEYGPTIPNVHHIECGSELVWVDRDSWALPYCPYCCKFMTAGEVGDDV